VAEIIENLAPIRILDPGDSGRLLRGPESTAVLLAHPDFEVDADLPLPILRPPVELLDGSSYYLHGVWNDERFYGSKYYLHGVWHSDVYYHHCKPPFTPGRYPFVAHNVDTGDVLVLHEWAHPSGDVSISRRGDIAYTDPEKQEFAVFQRTGKMRFPGDFEAPPDLPPFGRAELGWDAVYPNSVAFLGDEMYVGGGEDMQRIDVFEYSSGRYLRTIHPAVTPRVPREGRLEHHPLFGWFTVCKSGRLLVASSLDCRTDLCDAEGRPLRTYIWNPAHDSEADERLHPRGGGFLDDDGNLWAGINRWPHRWLFGCYPIRVDQ